MPYQQKAVKLWHKVGWLPGYLVHKHKRDITTAQKAILGVKAKLNKELLETEKLNFNIIETARFTLIKEVAADKLIELLPANKDFKKTADKFSEKTLAKLAYELSTKHTNKNYEDLAAIQKAPLFQENSKLLVEKYGVKSFTPKKTVGGLPSARSLPKPFRYFGNSMNYMENTLKILEVSDSFSKASTIRDITCGSCALTFYLASKYPNKKYIASDINGEIINALNYIKQTSMDAIKSQYTHYHNMVFNLKPEQREAKYKELVAKFNQDNPKDYNLLIFLQNNAFTNVVFHKDGTISASLKRKATVKLSYWLQNMEKCKEIMAKNDIEFKKIDMHEAAAHAKEGEFYFMTPPHEHDQDGLYGHYIKKSELIDTLNSLSKKMIPYLITYGDNSNIASSDLRQRVNLHRFSYIIPGGLEKKPKKMSIYISSTVVADVKNRDSLVTYFVALAEKVKKSATKKLDELGKQEKCIEIETNIKFEELAHQLAIEILIDRPPQVDSQNTSNTPQVSINETPTSQPHSESVQNEKKAEFKELLPHTFFNARQGAERIRKKRRLEEESSFGEDELPSKKSKLTIDKGPTEFPQDEIPDTTLIPSY